MRNILVIGTSAGGIPSLKEVLAGLNNDIDASVFVVQHMSRSSDADVIVRLLQKHTAIHCMVAEDGMAIARGHLYFAPADHHMIVEERSIKIIYGTPENKYRPSIDVMFRSAASTYGNRVVAVILTGMLEDGTSGMSAVKRCGGITVVQNPDSAQFSGMPASIVANVGVDYVTDLEKISSVINDIINQPLPLQVPIPKEIQIEAEITKNMMTNIDQLKSIADRSDFVCPDCGGGLWAVRNEPTPRYRCYTGHVYTEKLLGEIQDDRIEESVWISIRMLEEKSHLLEVMAARQTVDQQRYDSYSRRTDELKSHVIDLRNFCMH